MLHFFRKIRHDLIANSKTYKYFKYAVGEVVLVMIGILLALQVNNWNENRKLKLTQITILKGIYSDLKKDTIDINDNIRDLRYRVTIDSLLLNHLINKKEQTPDVKIWMATAVFIRRNLYLHNTFYNEATNKGFEIITNVELRERIVRLYEFYYKKRMYEENIDPTFQFHTKFNDQLGKFLAINSQGKLSSIHQADYIDLINDKKLHFQLDVIQYRRKRRLNHTYLSLIKNVNSTMELISKEILLLEK